MYVCVAVYVCVCSSELVTDHVCYIGVISSLHLVDFNIMILSRYFSSMNSLTLIQYIAQHTHRCCPFEFKIREYFSQALNFILKTPFSNIFFYNSPPHDHRWSEYFVINSFSNLRHLKPDHYIYLNTYYINI